MKSCNFTHHAIEQFIRRWEPDKTPEQAEEELQALYRTSKTTGKTPLNDKIVSSPFRSEIRMVIKDGNVCVTVLPKGKDNILQEEMDYVAQMYAEEVIEIKSRIEVLEKNAAAIQKEREVLAVKRSNILNEIKSLQNDLKWKDVFKEKVG